MRKNKFTALVGAGAILLGTLTTPLMAGSFGIGVAGLGLLGETDGTETLKTTSVKTSKRGVNGTGTVAAGYIQYTFGENGFVVGLEKIPGSATLGSNTVTVTDKLTDGSGTAVTQHAEAKIDNHRGAYIESPSLGGLYLKVGYSEVDLTTQESLGTGSAYGDDTMSGTTVGVGFRGTHDSGIHLKFAVERTDYDSVKLTSTGSDVASKIDADLTTYGARLSIGYNF